MSCLTRLRNKNAGTIKAMNPAFELQPLLCGPVPRARPNVRLHLRKPGVTPVLETSIEREFNFRRTPSSLLFWTAGYPQRPAGGARYGHEHFFR